MLIALAVPGLDAEAIEWAVLRAGHRVAWRAADSDEVLTQLAQLAPDAVLLSDDPAVATATIVGSCDLLGVRSCLVVDDRPLSVGSARLELADVLRLGPDSALDLSPLDAVGVPTSITPPMPGPAPAVPQPRLPVNAPPVPPMPRGVTPAVSAPRAAPSSAPGAATGIGEGV
ncbi:MAG: hypothetical protein Q7J04_04665, partial [Microcella sp.]|nr:hypothetical protein [Microcella sp.]